MTEPDTIALIVLTFLVAGAVKGVIGLGLPTVSLGILTAALDLPTAMALLIVPSFVTNAYQAAVGGNGRIILARIWPFLVMATVTVWIGARMLTVLDLDLLSGLLGLLLIAYAGINLAGVRIAIPASREAWAGPAFGIANGILRLFRVEPKDEVTSAYTAEEVHHIVEESHREGLVEEDQFDLLGAALEFSDKTAGDVGVPVGDLVTLPQGATPEQVERLVAKTGFSRFPTVNPAGEVSGYLHLKDVLYADADDYHLPVPAKRLRRLATVRPEDEVEDVLATMQRTGTHLARVVGPDGAVRGVVFLEDVIEELVGEVLDDSQR